jgi:mannosyltransferase OCH1-like enzyme
VYTRHVLADRWHMPPWEVDEAPGDEIVRELHLMAIEAECQPKKK